MSTPNELDLATLNREIAQLETESQRLEIERAAVAKTVGQLTRQKRYLNLARWLRKPAALHAAYPLALLAIGPLVVGVGAFVLLSLVINSWTLALPAQTISDATCFHLLWEASPTPIELSLHGSAALPPPRLAPNPCVCLLFTWPKIANPACKNSPTGPPLTSPATKRGENGSPDAVCRSAAPR